MANRAKTIRAKYSGQGGERAGVSGRASTRASSSSGSAVGPNAGLWRYLQFMGSMSAEQAGMQAELAGAQIGIAGAQVGLSERQVDMAEDRYKFFSDYYKPLEKQILQQVGVGIDPTYASARAGADVTASFDKAQQAAGRDMERRGIDASSPQFSQQQAQIAIARAAAEAGARGQARNVTNDANYSRKYSQAALGRDMVSQSANLSGLAASTYGAAAGTLRGASGTLATGLQGVQNAAGIGLNAAQMNNNMILGQQQVNAQNQASQGQMVGSIVGTGIGVASLFA